MRRRNLLIMLFVAIGVGALSAPITRDALAEDTGNMPYPTPPAPVSAGINDKEYPPIEPVEISSPAGDEATPATNVDQTASLNDETYVKEQGVLSEIEVSQLRQLTTGSHATTVAVLDTGIDSKHEELSGQVIAETNLSGSFTPGDIHGHGTHVAGIIAAKDDSHGIIGIAAGCSLLNVKVADDMGRCQALALAKGIIWAVDNEANVINISIEISEPSPKLESAINYAWSQGSLIVAAAGNHGSESPAYPAYYENCVAVAASGPDNNLAPLSNHGDWVDVVAPGLAIYSTLPDNGYGCKSGTSFACAYVSGVAALLFDVVTDTNSDGKLNDEVRAVIEAGCREIDLAGIVSGS